MVLFGLFRFAFFCFGLIETLKLAVSVWNRNNRNKHFFFDSAETSFGSIFSCFESKLVLLDTIFAPLKVAYLKLYTTLVVFLTSLELFFAFFYISEVHHDLIG